MKEHNADYLNNDSLKWHPRLGIHAVNVAPEFGVAETKAFIDILKRHKLTNLINDFYEYAYNSLKWQKWMLPNTTKTKSEMSIIAGHYVFSSKNFIDLKNKAYAIVGEKNLEEELKLKVKESIFRYVRNFRLA